MLQCRRISSGEVQDSKAWERSGGSVSGTRGRHCSDSREKVVQQQKEKELSVTHVCQPKACHTLLAFARVEKRSNVSASAVSQLLILQPTRLIAKV